MASHFALFVDLENCGGKKSMLMDVIERVKIRGDILIGKVYGYTDSYSDLKEILLSNTFAVVPSLRFGRNQKNSLDIQLVIDALDVAYTNSLIDSFCIVSGDSDYVPLVGKLKTMGKFVLGISRSEAASGVFMNACSEFQFLESVASGKERAQGQEIEALTLSDVNDLIVTILKESDSGEMLASEVKSVLLRLRPNFSEKSVGFSTFGKLIARLSQQFGAFTVESEQFNVIVSLNQPHTPAGEQITRENYARIFARILSEYKEDGFDRVNPSILKSAVQADYPDFTERQIGLRRFSDVLRALEREKLRSGNGRGGNMLVLFVRGEKNGWGAAPNPGRNLRFRHLPFSLSRSDKGRIKLRLRIECTEKIHETYSFIFDFHFAGDGRIGGGRADRCDGRGARRV